jgi:hypothetical protein
MKNSQGTSNAERVGAWLGRLWRLLGRREVHVTRWMINRGLAPTLAKGIVWTAKLAIIAMILYAALWFAIAVAFVVVVATLARHSDYVHGERMDSGEQADHRKGLFYDPIVYNDDPDPRFHGE